VYHSLAAAVKSTLWPNVPLEAPFHNGYPGRVQLRTRMTEHQTHASEHPLFSIIIAVYEDWAPLDQCLRSLAQQNDDVPFEVIIVDDGSTAAAPEFISRWIESYPLTVIQQSHAGISAARNRGVQASNGAILVFTDADCRFQPKCLVALGRATMEFPEHKHFQLHLVGDCVGTVGRAEELRLAMLQDHLLGADGRIRYLNTSGFAIRRTAVNIAKGVFDPVALRAEDTFLMATLMQRGELPLFVPNATVQHAIPLSLTANLRKDLRSIYLEAKTYDLIATKGVKFRLGHRERLGMLWAMWKASGQRSIGRSAWFVVTLRQGLRLVASYAYRCFRAVRLTSTQP
jgi:glycosyltransferase involved in cell wall biosynthesis